MVHGNYDTGGKVLAVFQGAVQHNAQRLLSHLALAQLVGIVKIAVLRMHRKLYVLIDDVAIAFPSAFLLYVSILFT